MIMRPVILCILTIVLAQRTTVLAQEPGVPWECSNYSGDAPTRCMNGLLEEQRKRIGHLEGQVQSQQSQ